jgi:SGNH domain (fused to AT3 domains)
VALLIVCTGLSTAATLVSVGESRAAGKPRCFGAAARDPQHRCVNRRLTSMVVPDPRHAMQQPSSPCAQVRFKTPGICAFGVSRRRASSTVALIGDSHAIHWRAALAVVARSAHWHGLSIARPNCPFTFARTGGHGDCAGWAQSIVRWLSHHKDVRTVFVSANAAWPVAPAAGESPLTTKIKGYVAAWNALPPTVREVFVIHDVPHSSRSAGGCIARALALGRNPGQRCARRRSRTLPNDHEVIAAQRSGSPRVKVIDLTPFMCSPSKCFPVVGGALVIKDFGHLTRTFSTSLGPYLGRAISRLRAAG